MSLLPLALGVRRNPDAQGGGARRKPLARPQVTKLLRHTLEKDKYTCRYCGFTARHFQKAIPKDWAFSDPRDGELVTACIFCEQCLALDNVPAMASGALIWMPSLPQIAINHLARTIYAARAFKDKLPEKIKLCADRALEVLTQGREEAKRRIQTDDPAVMAAVFLESLDDKTYRTRNEKLDGVRLLPLDKRITSTRDGDSDMFPKIAASWISKDGPYGNLSPESWESLL